MDRVFPRAGVEDIYFSWRLSGRDPGAPWNSVDWENDHDWDWRTAAEVGSLRRMLIDLTEEYAPHVGHADLIRESIDGLVGEDPPAGA